MKYVFIFFAMLLAGWPALVAGYIYGAVRSGFTAGQRLYDRGETAAIENFGD